MNGDDQQSSQQPSAARALDALIAAANHIVIIQADNPDGDSLSSALALESILTAAGKTVSLYCGVVIPTYLRHLEGWDRVEQALPKQFDASIIVDTVARSLLEQLEAGGDIKKVASKPCAIIDHHSGATVTIDFATVTYLVPAVSATEAIYELSEMLKWPRPHVANYMIAAGILSDSLGLTSEGTSARSIHIIGELVEQGVSIPELENARRALQKKSLRITKYKAALLDRIEITDDGQIASVAIPWEEIEAYSHEYNPSMLVIDDMRMVEGVQLAIAFKLYPDGRITGKLRANYGFGVAGEVAKQFGGGGHPYAAGFRVTDGKPYNEVKSECIAAAHLALSQLNEGKNHETIQYKHTVG